MADFLLQDEDPKDDDPSETLFLQRWVERPDGELELMDLPLTPELFLDPQVEDKFLQDPGITKSGSTWPYSSRLTCSPRGTMPAFSRT